MEKPRLTQSRAGTPFLQKVPGSKQMGKQAFLRVFHAANIGLTQKLNAPLQVVIHRRLTLVENTSFAELVLLNH